MIYEKLSGSTEVFVANSGDQQPPASEVGSNRRRAVNRECSSIFAGPKFERQDRFHFEDGEPRDEALGARQGDYPVYEVASKLDPVHFC